MTLNNYLKQFNRFDRAETIRSIATSMGVTQGAVRHWSNGTRLIDATNAVLLEKHLKGKVTRAEMRPDIFG